MNDLVMTADEVATAFKVSVNTARRWAKDGRLGAFRVDPAGDWRFPRARVREALDGSEQGV